MTLQAFSFPVSETRFMRTGNFIYKFEIRPGSSYSLDDFTGGNCLNQELEEIIRTVLHNLDGLQPFSSPRFNVFPYKKPWHGASEELCCRCQRNFRTYAFIIVLHLELKRQNEKRAEEKLSPEKKEVAHQIPSVSEPQSKRRRQDSPLEGAIIKDFIRDFEAETEASVVRPHVSNPHAEEDEVKEAPGHADEKRTEGSDEAQQESCVDMVEGAQSEVHPGTHQDVGEEEDDENGENADSAPETPEEPGMLTQLASHIFPFSMFVRKTREPRQTDGKLRWFQ